MTQTVSELDRMMIATAVARLAAAARNVSELWETLGLPPDFYTAETGYPFGESLDEVAAKLAEWKDATWQDAEIEAGRA